MRVMCIQGHEGILEEGETYHVSEVTDKGNYLLFEVDPPDPYMCFNKNRFVPLTDPTQEELMDTIEESKYGGD